MCLIYRKHILHLKLLNIICSAYIITNCFLVEWIILGRKDAQTLQLRISTELWGPAIQNPNMVCLFFPCLYCEWVNSVVLSKLHIWLAEQSLFRVLPYERTQTWTCNRWQPWYTNAYTCGNTVLKINVAFTEVFFSLLTLWSALPLSGRGTGTTYFLHKLSFSIW